MTSEGFDPPTESECITCGEPGSGVEGECPHSKRPCGHHCNCTWTQDICHWCGAEVNDDGVLVPNFAPIDMEHAHA